MASASPVPDRRVPSLAPPTVRGGRPGWRGDAYHRILSLSWGRLLCALFATFVAFNAVFALLYRAGGDCIGAAHPGSFLEAFSFSVQTMASIGYGTMAPTTPYAYLLSNLEGFLGLLGVAMASAFLFAKFSTPTASVVFSRNMVVHKRNGVPTLHFRMANMRGNQLVEANLSVVLLVNTVSTEGDTLRRLVDLPLVRDRTPAFSLSWTAMHVLDETSPLLGLVSSGGCDPSLLAILVTLTGMDGTFSQTVHTQARYQPEHLLWGHRFSDMVSSGQDGLFVHLDRIDHTVPGAPA